MRVKLQLVMCSDDGREETVTDLITLKKDSQRIGPYTCTLRINTMGLPTDRHQGKKAWMRGRSCHLSGPLTPGDALNAGRADARRPLRPSYRVASHPPARIHPHWLRPR